MIKKKWHRQLLNGKERILALQMCSVLLLKDPRVFPFVMMTVKVDACFAVLWMSVIFGFFSLLCNCMNMCEAGTVMNVCLPREQLRGCLRGLSNHRPHNIKTGTLIIFKSAEFKQQGSEWHLCL